MHKARRQTACRGRKETIQSTNIHNTITLTCVYTHNVIYTDIHTRACAHTHRHTFLLEHCRMSFFPFTVTTDSGYRMNTTQLSASYSSYEVMHPAVPSTEPATRPNLQVQPGRQTLHLYQSLKETSPESGYTLPIARPHQVR